MSAPIIKVENVSKKFIITHEAQEKYLTLRDSMASKARRLFSFPGKKSGAGANTKEAFMALKDVSFDVYQGDRVGIIGRNGAGKSTLLKILSQITEPSSGRISINGRLASLLEVGTGFHPELSGRENIYLNGAILGMARVDIRKKFDEIVEFAEVERFLDTPVKRYSSGMYVRLAFAVAAHLEPEILIIDEVLAVGDVQFQKKCLGKMEDVSRNGRTVLFVSHNMGVIAQLCNKGILLNKGRVESAGSVDTIVEKYITNSSNESNGYEASAEVASTKRNFFNSICVVNKADEMVSDFSFDESIRLKFHFTINDLIPNLQIGIGIQDKLQNRVCTILKPVTFFSNDGGNRFAGIVDLPSSTFAPNSYSFVFVIWAKDINVYESLENICGVKIHDNGTEFAVYEGLDYGNIIINPKWSNA
jgi:lipopolysaccharide transport system ATP-binding protein